MNRYGPPMPYWYCLSSPQFITEYKKNMLYNNPKNPHFSDMNDLKEDKLF